MRFAVPPVTPQSMSSKENYSLRWNNHQNHILRAFDALLQSKTLVDVTLVCAETSIRAHKVVLSACSPFFQRVFNETPCKHPVIVLKDFRGWIVQAIIDFMYRGEISVPQAKLQQLIQAGESLQVRGLIDHSVLGGTPVSVAESDEFATTNSLNSTPAVSPATTNYPTAPTTASQQAQLFNLEPSSDLCVSPMPRRKQARPRRRSGDCEPQDLSNGVQAKPQKLDTELLLSDTEPEQEPDDLELHDLTKNVVNHYIRQQSVEEDADDLELTTNERMLIPSKRYKKNDNNNNTAETAKGDEDPEKENQPNADAPENLCTKNGTTTTTGSAPSTENHTNGNGVSAPSDSDLLNDKNNNSSVGKQSAGKEQREKRNSSSADDLQERFILSLKDIRSLNRPYRPSHHSHHHSQLHHHPHPHHFNEILSHLPLSPPTPPFHHNSMGSFHMRDHSNHVGDPHDHNGTSNTNSSHQHNNSSGNKSLKIENDRSDDESPILEQIDLSMAGHHHHHGPFGGGSHSSAAAAAAVAAFEREHNKHKQNLLNSQQLNFGGSPFQQSDMHGGGGGRHTHPSSPLSFPGMPSVSSLALTPPHSK